VKSRRIVKAARVWSRETRELRSFVLGVCLLGLVPVGLSTGWLKLSGGWFYVWLVLGLLDVIYSAAKLGWIDKALGTRFAARLWAREALGLLRMGRATDAKWCMERARDFASIGGRSRHGSGGARVRGEQTRDTGVVCPATARRGFGVRRAAQKLQGSALTLWGTRCIRHGQPAQAAWLLLRAQALFRAAGALEEEIHCHERLLFCEHAIPKRQLVEMALRGRYVRRLLDMETLGAAVRMAESAVEAVSSGKLRVATRHLDAVRQSHPKASVRDRKAEVVLLVARAYLEDAKGSPLAQDYARQAAEVLHEVLSLETPHSPSVRDLPPVATGDLPWVISACANRLPADFSWVVHFLLALLFADGEQREAARTECLAAIRCVETARLARNTDEQRQRFMTKDKMLAYDWIISDRCSDLGQLSTSARHDRCVEVFDFVERAKGRALLDALELEAITPRTEAAVCNVAAVQELMCEDAAIVEYYICNDLLLGMLVTKDSIDVPLLLRGAARREVSTCIAEFEEGMSSLSNSIRGILEQLNGLVWKPIDAALRQLQGYDQRAGVHLHIVPHGPLHRVPFCALHDGTRFLVEEHSVTQVPSASVLHWLWRTRPMATTPATFLGIANPRPPMGSAFLPAWTGWGNIGGCEESVEYGAQHFPHDNLHQRVFCGAEATYERLLEHLPWADIVDLETHADHDPNLPSQAFFLMAATDGRPRKVSARDVVTELRPRMSRGVELVVLATCRGGEVGATPGDDFQGLARSFLIAGARSVLGYRWPLIDEKSVVPGSAGIEAPLGAAILQEFYRALLEDRVSKADALAGAQRRLIKWRGAPTFGNLPCWDHPYFWAWTLVGDGI
jgi:CHAT domain-containing protein